MEEVHENSHFVYYYSERPSWTRYGGSCTISCVQIRYTDCHFSGYAKKIGIRETRDKALQTDEKMDTPIEALWNLQKHLVTESAHYGIPVVKLTHFDSAVSKIMQLAVQEIEKQISKERLFENALENLRTLLEEVHAPAKH